jgi:hypothetical protein
MAEDFGDDAGQQLYEWTMRIGLYASGRPGAGSSQEQVQRAVDRLTAALEHARDMAPEAVGHEASLPEYAKLDLHEFKGLDDFPAVRSAIDARLSSDGLLHYFNDDERGRSWLVFRTADAPGVSASFDTLVGDARKAGERAAAEIRSQTRRDREAGREEEPLAGRASRAKAASRAQEETRAPEHAPEPRRHKQETRAK